ncbi:two-component system sensor histidine kinase NtrB [Halanaerobacter jeridensis]|uniref:histidine kinase n=1 Tax=Halanaerobacter jeridensis TaxID=706427 RepID=A0A938XNY2_9FIRM|nr:ATP-binding protein [Halanaerobacter jeridensis]MBM7556363.1 signal transduction histidine kinase [Halanaerobacter jeridensis]
MNYIQQDRQQLINQLEKLEKENNQLRKFFNRIELAIGEGNLIVAQCDEDLRYEWIYNIHSNFNNQKAVGKRDDELEQGPGIEKLMSLKRKVLETGQKIRRGITFHFSDQEIVYYVMAKPVINEQDSIVGVFTVSVDVTEFKKTHQQIMQQNKNQVMRQLALGISHQINNMLAIVMGDAELILFESKKNDNQLPQKSIQMINDIKKQCNKAKQLILDLNSMVETKSDNTQKCLITNLIEDILFDFNWPEYNVEVERRYEDVSKIKVDKSKLKKALSNIITNAYQAVMTKENTKITIAVTETSKTIRIKIKDTGSGMSDEVQEKIFLPLYTTKGEWSQDNNQIKGLGLGLTIAEKIIKDHQGEIKVESQVGEGSIFIIDLAKN